MKRREFIAGCVGCTSLAAMAAAGIGYYKKNNDIDPDLIIWDDFPHLEHVEIYLTEHCNLGCKYCSHFSNIAKEKYYDVKQYKKDMTRLASVTDSKIKTIQLTGGEPLLHPQVNDFFKITRELFPLSQIEIRTNGIMLDSMDSSFWKSLHKNNVYLIASVYPVGLNWEPIFKKAKKYDVIFTTSSNYPRVKLDDINKYTKYTFYKSVLDLNGKQDYKKNYQNCNFKIPCTNYSDGKLYPCFKISNIKHFNEKFNQNLEVTKDDYIDVYKVNSIEEILELYKNPAPFCRYCNDVFYDMPWENIKEHSIEEWV